MQRLNFILQLRDPDFLTQIAPLGFGQGPSRNRRRNNARRETLARWNWERGFRASRQRRNPKSAVSGRNCSNITRNYGLCCVSHGKKRWAND